MIFAVKDLPPLTVHINCSFYIYFAVLLPLLSRNILSFSVITAILEKNEHKAEASSTQYVKLLEIRALWYWA